MKGSKLRCIRPLALALSLLTLAAATNGSLGCKKLGKGNADAGSDASSSAGSSAASPATATPQDDADEQMQDKIEPYTDCLNALSSSVHETHSRYTSWVDPRTGPTGRERIILGVLALPKDAAQDCTKHLTKAKQMPPTDTKLEAAGAEFARTVTELDGLIDQVFGYYEAKDYKSDKFAKGKAIHPKLVAAFADFSKADSALRATLDALTKPLAARALARIEREEGKSFRFHKRNVMFRARELVEAGDPVGEDDDVDLALYNTQFTAFEKALTELTAFGAVHKKELDNQSNSAWPHASRNFDQFSRAADDYLKKSREFLRCLREAPAKAKSPKGKVDLDKLEKLMPCPDGRRRDVVTKYNDLIQVSNTHPFP